MTRVGFVGTGSFARQHAEVLSELSANIVACYGANAEKTSAFASDFHCKRYTDPLQLISNNIIDALYIVVPPFAHDGSVELKAIAQKIPFLCEKPVGLDLPLCEKISKEIIANNIITSSGYLLRYEPLFMKIKEIVRRNKISTVRICSYSYMPEVHWWRKERLSGGIARESIAGCDMEDSTEAVLKFESNVIASIGMTHLLNKIHARNDELQVYGQDFALKVDLYKLRYKNEAIAYYKEAGDEDWRNISNKTSKKDLLKCESSAFISATRKNNDALIKSTYPDAVKSLRVSLAINQSAKLNHTLTI